MALIVKDRVLESSTSTGTGSFTLTGAQTGYQSFSAIGNGNTTYYTIQGKNPDGTLTGEWEVGTGTWSTGNTLARDTVLSNSLGTTAKIAFSAGDKDVFVTYPSDKALLGTTSAVASTGTGSVVLNSNPIFDTDITVNGMYVGKGYWQTTGSSAFGIAALESPYGTSFNTAMTGIGFNTLSSFGNGVLSFRNIVGGSGYNDGTYNITLEWLSGTNIISGGTFPTVTLTVSGGSVVSIDAITNAGIGFSDITTVFYYTGGDLGAGSGFTCQINNLLTATNNTALGYGAGSTNLTGSNSVYLGYGANGTGSNEIVIGANATGFGDNTVVIGDGSITSTTLRGTTNVVGLTASGSLQLTGSSIANQNIATNQSTGTLAIGGASATGATNIGRSTLTHTFNIDNGTLAAFTTRTINIGVAGAASGLTNTTIGTTGVQGSVRSVTLINGTIRQQTFTVATLPTGVAGARSFVTNALAPAFGAAVAGGGAVGVPVYHDGTSWKVG